MTTTTTPRNAHEYEETTGPGLTFYCGKCHMTGVAVVGVSFVRCDCNQKGCECCSAPIDADSASGLCFSCSFDRARFPRMTAKQHQRKLQPRRSR